MALAPCHECQRAGPAPLPLPGRATALLRVRTWGSRRLRSAESSGAPSLLPALHPPARGEVADTAARGWHGATRGDNVPRSDPLGTVPRAEGLRCPSARCQVRGEGGGWGGTHSDAPPAPCQAGGRTPPLARRRVLRDSPCGALPAATGTSWRGSEPREVLGSRAGIFPLQRRLHAPKAPGVGSSRSRGTGQASGSSAGLGARCAAGPRLRAPLGGRLAGD